MSDSNNTTPWERVKAGSQAAIITGGVIWQATAPMVPPTARPDTQATPQHLTSQTVEKPHAQIPSIEDLAQDAADWQETRLEADRRRNMELGYQLREPEYRDERGR